MAGTSTCHTGKTLIMTQPAVSQHHEYSPQREAMKQKITSFIQSVLCGKKKGGKKSVDMWADISAVLSHETQSRLIKINWSDYTPNQSGYWLFLRWGINSIIQSEEDFLCSGCQTGFPGLWWHIKKKMGIIFNSLSLNCELLLIF